MRDVHDAARDKWGSILPTLGIDARFLTGKHGPCPVCSPGGEGKDRFRFTNREGSGSAFCSKCGGFNTGIDLLMAAKGLDFKEAAREVERVAGVAPVQKTKELDPEDKRRLMNEDWLAGRPALDLATYLGSRGLTVPDCPDMRFLPKCRHSAGLVFPAMLGLVRTREGRPICLHRTYLAKSLDRKAGVDPARKMLGSMPEGAALRLFPAGPIMGIAEGIETALSAAQMFNLPVWAAINDDRLAKWTPPAECTEVRIFGDCDASHAGQAAAHTLAKRLVAQGLRSTVELPPSIGQDWNDVLTAHQRRAA